MEKGNGKIITFFAFINFVLQLLSLYKQKNFIFHQILGVFVGNCRGFFPSVQVFKRNNHPDLSSIIAGSTNEVVIAMTITLINFLIFEKPVRYPVFDLGLLSKNELCKQNLDKEVKFSGEALCFLFGSNFFLFLYLILKMKDKRRTKFRWKFESYGLFMKTYYFIMLYFLIDINFQFYLYLYLLNKVVSPEL